MSSERSRGLVSRKPRAGRSPFLKWLGLLAAVGVLAGTAGAGFFYVAFVRDLPDLSTVADYTPALTSHVYDRNGQPIGSFFKERREITRYEEIPAQVVQAFISAEDASFFEHQGIDLKAIARAAWANFTDETMQGASTITQQTVKTLLLTPERTYTRKLKEVILARRLEERLSKEEILFLYLNQIYFGHGAYGIGAAARAYFDKSVGELELAETALLAGLPKAPSKFSPYHNAERAETRRQYVLRRMRAEGFIDEESYARASQMPPPLVETPPNQADFQAAAYFTEGVRRYLFESLGGERVLTGGLRIETTLDIDKQKAAVASLRRGVEKLDRRQGYRGHVRQVGAEGVAATVTALLVENGFAAPPEEGNEPAPETGDLVALAREKLAERKPLLGVVTRVDPASKLAHVALAPGVTGVAHLEDVNWARPADPKERPWRVKKIRTVFSEGDVAWFQTASRHRMDKEAAEARAELDEALAAAVPEGEAPPDVLHLTLFQKPTAQAALISLDTDETEVIALVGGYDFEESEFDRVTQARRQPGSAFKPLIYGTALTLREEDEEGNETHPWTPASTVYASAQIYEDKETGFVWKPANYNRKFLGAITLRNALKRSINTAAIQLASEVGVSDIIEFSQRLGIESPLERSLGIALGTNEVTLLELTRAYAVFPNKGRRVEPIFIRRVLDAEGRVLIDNVVIDSEPVVIPPPGAEDPASPQTLEPEPAEEAIEIAAVEPEFIAAQNEDAPQESEALQLGPDGEPLPPEEPVDPNQLMREEDAFLMADLLKAVVREGTGRKLTVLGRPLGGKTGTTNDQADAWFVGFSPGITTGVWVGHDASHKLGFGETGSGAAAPIWVDYMRVALEDRPIRDFDAPDSIVYTRIDKKTGLLASAATEETLFQAFISGSEPTAQVEARRTDTNALRDLRGEDFGDASLRVMQLDSF